MCFKLLTGPIPRVWVQYLCLILVFPLVNLACSENSQLWQWERAENGLSREMMVLAVTGHPDNPDLLWAGYYGNGGLISSSDSGATWQLRPVGTTDNPVFDLVHQGSYLWAATRDGLYYSEDNGQNWVLADGLDRGPVLSLAKDGAGQLYAGLDRGGIRHKTVSGWRNLGSDRSKMASAGVLSLAVSPNGQHLVAGTAAMGVFASRDGGQNWTQTYAGEYAPEVAINPAHPSEAVAGLRNRLVRTQDGGLSWHTLPLPWAEEEIVALLWLPEGVLGAGTSQGHLFQSIDGGDTWFTGGTGLPATGILDLTSLNSGRLLAATWTGLYISTDNGRQWNVVPVEFGSVDGRTLLNNGDSLLLGTRSALYSWQPAAMKWERLSGQTPSGAQVLTPGVADPMTIYAGTSSHGIYVSRDGGIQWQSLSTLQKGVPAIAVNPTQPDQIFYLAAWERVYESGNGGLSWQARWDGLGEVIETISLAVDPVAPIAYVGTENGLFRLVEGQPWELVAPSLVDHSVLALLPRPAVGMGASGTELLIGTTRGAFLSLDNGQTVTGSAWGVGLENVSVTAFLSNPRARRHLIAGTAYSGLYESYDNGRTWKQIGPPELVDGVVESLAWSSDGALFVAATHGVWRGLSG
jgi:photosystem II stability/assembly factor-like uncharacterized protein